MKGAVSIPINVSAIPPRGEPGEEAYHKGNDLGGRTAYARKRFFSHKLSHDHTVDRIIKLLKKSSEQDREEEQEKLLPDDAFCNLVFCLLYGFHEKFSFERIRHMYYNLSH